VSPGQGCRHSQVVFLTKFFRGGLFGISLVQVVSYVKNSTRGAPCPRQAAAGGAGAAVSAYVGASGSLDAMCGIGQHITWGVRSSIATVRCWAGSRVAGSSFVCVFRLESGGVDSAIFLFTESVIDALGSVEGEAHSATSVLMSPSYPPAGG
jgi:hypothetical protein